MGLFRPVLYRHMMSPDVWSNEYTLPVDVPSSRMPLSVEGGDVAVSFPSKLNVHRLDCVTESIAYILGPSARNTVFPRPNAGE